MKMSKSRNTFTDAEANIQTHILTSFFDSPVSTHTEIVFATHPGRIIKDSIDYETQYAASLTTCAFLEDEDRLNAHLSRERKYCTTIEPHA